VTKPAAILDIDGTLVDSNYFHAVAWYRAMRAHDHTLPMWRIHRAIGMGGDQMIAALLGDDVEEREGDAIRDVEKERYFELIDEVQPLGGARELIEDLKRTDHRVVRPPRRSRTRSSTTSTCSTRGSSPTRGRRRATSRTRSPRRTS
jgi:phosphoglycolate phosphatase-like HAD superfamily hydrolase